MEFTLRPWTSADLPSLVRHANNSKIARFMTDGFPHPYAEENGQAFIAFATRDNPVHIFAIDVNGEAVGGIGIHPLSDIYRRNAELGYWLGEAYWGQGIITEAIGRIAEIGFTEFGLDRIFARPFGSNAASQRVLEKAGFVLEARFEKTIVKHEAYEDELVYALRRPAS